MYQPFTNHSPSIQYQLFTIKLLTAIPTSFVQSQTYFKLMPDKLPSIKRSQKKNKKNKSPNGDTKMVMNPMVECVKKHQQKQTLRNQVS